MALSKNLSQKLIALFRNAVNTSGSFAPEDNLLYFEESLTINEAHMTWAFFAWIHENKKTFGHNLPDVYKVFVKEAGQAYIDKYWAEQDEKEKKRDKSNDPKTFSLGVTVEEFQPRKK
tara:strand:- start:335 stop:688 length:354 start_codon:yes stop_codon:yes gene_type:complete